MDDTILFIAVVICVIGTMLTIYYMSYSRKWECVGDDCIMSPYGEFTKYRDCKKNCVKSSSFVCDNESQCIKADGNAGKYSSLEDCKNKCIPQQTSQQLYVPQYYYPYYPQSMLMRNEICSHGNCRRHIHSE